jgi:putative NADH-flavin reductase
MGLSQGHHQHQAISSGRIRHHKTLPLSSQFHTMSFTKIGLVGATGNLGPAILKALLDDGSFDVTVLSREDSSSTDSLAKHPRQRIVKVNFDDASSLTSSLRGIDAVISNVASHALPSQRQIIDAAITAGVQRFLPSEFGSDLSVPANGAVPFNKPKLEIRHYLQDQAKNHEDFSYTFVTNGPFLDWCLQMGLFGNLKTHEATLWDGGDTRVSTTTLASVGRAVVGILKNVEATRNKEIRVADTTVTQKQIIDIVKQLDGKEWTTTEGSTAEAYRIGVDEMAKPQPDMYVAVMNQLYRILYSTEHGTDFGDKLDNELVGLSLMSEEQVRDVVKGCL